MDKKTTKSEIIVLDTETTGPNPHSCKLIGVALNNGGNISYDDGSSLQYEKWYQKQEGYIAGQNIKYDLIVLRRHGFKVPAPKFDTMIAAYMLHIDKARKLETMVGEIFGVHKDDLVQVYNKSTGESRVNLPDDWFTKIDLDMLATYSMSDVDWTLKLVEYFKKELEAQPELSKWFYEVEMPLVDIIAQMELKGVKVDRKKLSELRDTLKVRAEKLHKRLIYLAGNGPDVNLGSTKQLREILFQKFGLPVCGRTNKGEPSTDKDALELMVKKTDHCFPILLLQYKQIEKILSTYTDSLIEKLDENDRLHTVYNQALTHTRRFSSETPNLQNIPTRSDLGKLIKASFVPEAGHNFLVADYSQLEPRILAHLSDDKFLCKCFKNNEDIYNYTTSIVKAAGFENFTRDKSKILFLALMYGKSAYGLANDWKCSETEAQAIIDAVFSKLTGVKEYIHSVQEEAFRTGGWLKSLAGLPLYVGNPHSNNKWERMEVDRKAVNYPIQSSSQDILKKAIVNIHQKRDLYPVLMVHDELVFELKSWEGLHPGEHGQLKDQLLSKGIVEDMESAWKLKVPLKVEYKITNKWEK